MARELYEEISVFREDFDLCRQIGHECLGLDIALALFPQKDYNRQRPHDAGPFA